MRYRALVVLAVSGILGFRVGMVAFPDWQVAVETAQVTAGVVQYPAATPFFLYHTKLWTVLHQILAILLRLGVSEIRLSLVVSGLLGMVSFQALAMFVFALSQDALLAIGSPLLIFATRGSDFGVVYPIVLAGSSQTYGIVGLSLFVLVVSLFGAGCYRTGAFLLGVAPAFHPSLGFWLWVVFGLALAWDFRSTREAAGHALRYFVAGCLVTVGSIAAHQASAFPADRIDPESAARYLTAFVRLWDGHRQPVSLDMDGVVLNQGALVVALLWLFAFRAGLTRSAAFLLRIVVAAAALSLVLVILSSAPPESIPSTLLILMPTRLANFNAMTFVALLLGIIGAYRARAWSPALALLLAVGLLLDGRSLLWTWLQERGRIVGPPAWTVRLDVWTVLETASVALVALTLLEWRRHRAGGLPPDQPFMIRAVATGTRGALLLVMAGLAITLWQRSASPSPLLDHSETNTVFHEAARGKGLLITGGNLHLIQLRTRRPVLLDGGGLDGLPYAIDSGPEMERILRDVYEIDFFNPPAEARGGGAIPSPYNQVVWERFTPERWRAIRYQYQVTQVMTHAAWSLKLPVVAQDGDLRLYGIPD